MPPRVKIFFHIIIHFWNVFIWLLRNLLGFPEYHTTVSKFFYNFFLIITDRYKKQSGTWNMFLLLVMWREFYFHFILSHVRSYFPPHLSCLQFYFRLPQGNSSSVISCWWRIGPKIRIYKEPESGQKITLFLHFSWPEPSPPTFLLLIPLMPEPSWKSGRVGFSSAEACCNSDRKRQLFPPS